MPGEQKVPMLPGRTAGTGRPLWLAWYGMAAMGGGGQQKKMLRAGGKGSQTAEGAAGVVYRW